MTPIEGRGRLLITRHRNHAVMDPRALTRAVRRGELLRLRCGAYVRSEVWQALPIDEQRRLAVAAAEDAASAGLVFSHRSAAALWGVPLLGARTEPVDVRTTVAAGSRSEHGFRKHATQDLDQHVVQENGFLVTSVARTVVDLALSEPFQAGVVAADWALANGTSRDSLLEVLHEADPKRGRARARHVIGFADGASGSVGESRSRAQMELAGLVIPRLQEEFADRRGFIGRVDFFWPQCRLIGEFDGIGKFTDAEMLAGRTTEQALADEKRREDRLRNSERRPDVTRWLWETLGVAGALPALLLAAGVPRR